uniref:Uncharacterized protein n=1 Tax=Panagrolaimus sp. PS1159 TaxID=55785 RepID=A0AC35GWQ7_9BILA
EIFKLYKGDIRREKFPRKDLNSQYSNTSSADAFPKTPATKSSSISSLYQSMESLNTDSCAAKESSGWTKSSGKYDLPPGYSSTTTSAGYSTSTSESERKSVKLEKPMANEILMLRLVILESSYFSTIKRHRFEEELEAKIPLLAAIENLMGVSAGRNLFNSTTRIFYCPNETLNTESMLEMNAKEHGQLTMGELATNRGKISIVIDYTGKVVQSKRQPFKKSSLNY